MATGVITNPSTVTTHTITWVGTNTSLIRQNIRKIGAVVFMQIVFSWTDISSDEVIFILPTELRPQYLVEGRFVSSNSNITVNTMINQNGNVIVNSGNVAGSGNTRINIVYPVI